MARQLVFITGATGFIGSATAIAALKAGYRLRICVRKPSDKLQDLLSGYSEQVEFVTVSDWTAEAEFRGQLDGADYVIHLAHPLPSGTDKDYYFTPAVKATTALLKEAARVPSIKKVVITSSIAALMPLDGIPSGGVVKGEFSGFLGRLYRNWTDIIPEDNDWDFDVDETEDFTASNDPRGIPMRLYHASKLLANKTAWEFQKTAKPQYALVTLHPAFVYGRNLAQTTAEEIQESSNSLLWYAIMAGIPHHSYSQVPGVHINDVVEAHLKALDPAIPDRSRYLLSAKGGTWKEVADVIQQNYSDLGAKITLDIEEEFLSTDSSKAEAELGMRWRSWDQMVRDVVDQQLEFVKG
jgi:nucleoside-diphosphate-sugar epimerase